MKRADANPTGKGWNPHRRCAAAVLASAVKDLKMHNAKTTRLEARAWLRSRKAAGWMCLLGFEPEAVLEGLRRQGLL